MTARAQAATERERNAMPDGSIQRWLAAGALLALLLLSAGCREPRGAAATAPTGPARTVADWFVDKHYVEADQEASVKATAGAAKEKVTRELRMAQGARGGGYADSRAGRRVYYRHVAGEGPRHEYELRVDAGALSLKKTVVLELKEEGGVWRVVEIEETDLPPDEAGGGP